MNNYLTLTNLSALDKAHDFSSLLLSEEKTGLSSTSALLK